MCTNPKKAGLSSSLLTSQVSSFGQMASPHASLPGRILVTGASRGLGRGVALRLAAAGHSVAIHYAANEAAARETAAECSRAAPRAEQAFPIVGGDISRAHDRQRLVQEAFAALGGLDALINNAGIAPRRREDITEAAEEIFDEVLAVNLKGPYFLTQEVVRRWLAGADPCRLPGGRKILFVSSVSAELASVHRGEYCISKAGLAMAAQLWAVRLAGEGIQVFELRPGIMATDMTAAVREKYDNSIRGGLVPMQRWGEPEDVGRAAEALCAGAFPFSTGEVIRIDGGLSLRKL